MYKQTTNQKNPRYRRLLKCGLIGKDKKESIDITGNGRKQIVVINNVNWMLLQQLNWLEKILFPFLLE